MKIVVIGGTGLIGTKLVARLRQKGHEVVAASPASGVNTITGEGLAEALAGAQVVVDVANSPSFEDEAVLKFFETSGRNLLAAEAAAGVGHHVALSVVGTDRLPDSGYLRAKMAQENLIKASGIPYTIVRSTQFFEFVSGIAESAHRSAKRFACRPPCCSRSCPTTWPTPWPTSRSAHRSTAPSRSPDRKRCRSTSSSGDFSAPSTIRAMSSPTPTRATSAPSLTIDRSRRSARRGSARPVSTTGSAIRRRSDKPAAGRFTTTIMSCRSSTHAQSIMSRPGRAARPRAGRQRHLHARRRLNIGTCWCPA